MKAVDRIIAVIRNEVNTDRLSMRRITQKDTDDFYEILKKNEVGKWLAISKGMSFEETRQYVNQLVYHWHQYGFGIWKIIHKKTEHLMGHCGIRYIENTNDMEIIYLLDPKFWGKGYAVEAGKAAIHYAFTSIHVTKLYARVRVNNYHSKKVIEKLGFQYICDKVYEERELSYYHLSKEDFELKDI